MARVVTPPISTRFGLTRFGALFCGTALLALVGVGGSWDRAAIADDGADLAAAQALPFLAANAICRGSAGGKTGARREAALRYAAVLQPDTAGPRSLAPEPSNEGTGPASLIPASLSTSAETLLQDPPLPRLIDGAGSVSYTITTTNGRAQSYFNQGLNLAYGFNHREAERAFRAAEALDPTCALCAWGTALVLGPNINAAMAEDAVAPAYAAIQRALALAGGATAKEQALIEALATRYSNDPKADRVALDQAYAEAMTALAKRYPADDDIAALAAEAVMTTQPWDYWTAEKTSKGRAGEALALLKGVLARTPTHIGAIHFYIHMAEAGPEPESALPFARRLEAEAPNSGHLVHMPSHITFRVGLYKESLASNIAAVLADERFLEQSDDQGVYRYGYYPHNVHFLLVSAQMLGDETTSIRTAKKLSGLINKDLLGEALWTQPLASAPLLAMAQFGKADEVLGVPAPPAEFPVITAYWRYARARAFLQKNNPTAAKAEADSMSALLIDPIVKTLDGYAFPATGIITVAEAEVRGRVAWAERDYASAQEHLTKAVAAQDALPYLEPPYWYIPVRQTLGAVLLEAGEHTRAERVFREALLQVPNNAWALFGLSRTYDALGQDTAAARTRQQFEANWAGSQPPKLKEL